MRSLVKKLPDENSLRKAGGRRLELDHERVEGKVGRKEAAQTQIAGEEITAEIRAP